MTASTAVSFTCAPTAASPGAIRSSASAGAIMICPLPASPQAICSVWTPSVQDVSSEQAKLFVYPSLLGEDELPDEALRWQGDVSVRRWIFPDPILINGIRGYQIGDSRKDIHWRASARTGSLQVKTHDYTVFPRLMMVFNIDPEDNFWGVLSETQQEEMEYGIRTVATLCNWAIVNNMEVGLYSNAAFLSPRHLH